jgi:hypothetical protein
MIKNISGRRTGPEIKPKFDFFFVILQVKCGVWRAKEKGASLPSTKDEERDFEHYNMFIVKLGLISLKQGHIGRYWQQFVPFFFIFFIFFSVTNIAIISRYLRYYRQNQLRR